MCKRTLTGLILGINLLFYAVICRRGDDFHRAEACTNKEGAVNYLSGNRIVLSAENSDLDDTSDGTVTPQPTNPPTATSTPSSGEKPPAATEKPTSAPVPKGWNKTAKGKKYYILKNGKRAKGHRTITGNYPRLRRAGRWQKLRYSSVGQYCTRISGPYLFHSVVYTRYKDRYSLHKAEYKKLGKSASHGCIRLQVEDAKWIYDRASRCRVSLYYNKKAKYPLAKPKAKKIGRTSSKRYYDPTDPKAAAHHKVE